jgi:ABC-type transport system substrate-binding protein
VLVEPNAETRLIQMRTGALDETYISGLLVDQARQSRLRVVEATTNIVDYLQFNFASGPLAELRFRRAIAQAIDRKGLAESVYRGFEEPALQPAFDPVAARRVLAGAHLDLDFAIAGAWRSSSAAAALIADDLERVGVAVTIKSYATATFWGPKSAGGILERGRFDVALTSWSPGIDPDRSYLFDCDAVPPAGGNAGGYCDRAFDEAEARGMRSYEPAVPASVPKCRASSSSAALIGKAIPSSIARLVALTASGAFAAIRAAMRFASPSNSAAGTTVSTSPARKASAAPIISPERHRYIAIPRPARRAVRCEPP